MLVRVVSLTAALLLPVAALAQAPRIHGVVFADANGNGAREAGEKGIAGVLVSNQDDIVVSDSLGRFEIAPGPTGIVFVTLPTGYRSVGAFWRRARETAGTLQFALAPQQQSTTFSFVHASDPHIAPASVDRFRRFRAMTDSLHPAFVLMGGDLVRDAMSQQEPAAREYFDLFAAESKQLATPMWTVPGNHDHFGIIRSRSHVDPSHPLYNREMYRHYFGPDYYSFNYGGVHFIGLNTISPDDSAYYGDVDSLQLAWLGRDVAHVDSTTPIVTFNHIPLVSGFWNLIGYLDDPLVSSTARVHGVLRYRHTVGNVLEILDALRGHRYALGLGSHTHAPERLEFVSEGMRARFEVSPAIIGGMFLGPVIIPSGFTLYTVRNGEIDAGKFVRIDAPVMRPEAPVR